MRYLISGSLRCTLVLLATLLLCRYFQVTQAEPRAAQDHHQSVPPVASGTTQANGAQSAQESIFSLKALMNITGPVRSPFGDRRCLMCRFSVSLINYALKTNRGHSQIDKLVNNFCTAAHLESPSVCSKVAKVFNREITKVLTYGIITPNQICGLLTNNTCGHFHSPLDDWEINLEASQHVDRARLPPPPPTKFEDIQKQAATTTYRVVHLSDTHVDLKYAPGAPAKCQEPLCCQQTSTPLNNTSTTGEQQQQPKAGFWGSYGPCDLPLRTLEATLKYINATIESSRDIDYVIWTGDIQPHDVWAQSKRSASQVYDTVFAKIFEYLPSVRILPTFGNHEMVPVDSFSPSNLLDIARDDSPVWIYKKLYSFWSRWLPADTASTITKDGFYATSLKPGLKVISLNTNFCHSKNFWLFINSTDPGQQLQWLVHELQLSELTHEKVHIIGHIPPGSEDCLKVWSKNYNRILRRFSSTITGQFFGHTHNNEFEMFYEQEHEDVAAIAEADQEKERSQEQKRKVIQSLVRMNTTNLAVMNSSEAQNVSETLSKAVLDIVSSRVAKNVTLRPIGVGFIGPSVTTFVDLNPSFRIYNIDPKQGFQVTDFETLYINLTAANANTAHEPEWTSTGVFSKAFGINDTLPESMHALLVDIANDFRDLDDDDDGDLDNDDADNDNSDGAATTTTSKPAAGNNATSETPKLECNAANATEGKGCEDRGLDGDDRLFELFWFFNSFSDVFSRAKYDQITSEDKRKFLCRLFTGEAHNSSACDEFLPMATLFRISPRLIKSTSS